VNYLSLFSGIGGLDLGLDRAGMTCVGQVERDPFRRQVLAEHWPEVPRHDDVRTFGHWWSSRPRPAVDAVAGGVPCQPFSGAGRQRGVADERWGWPWFLDALDTTGAPVALVENVPGLLQDEEAFGWILADLHERGFDAEWSVVSACSVGAPHRRRRLFVVAFADGLAGQEARERMVFPEPAPPGRLDRALRLGGTAGRDWLAEPAVGRVADGIPDRVDRLAALGDAVVPAVSEYVGRLIHTAVAP
jgi:DNA (cytosine-5)-methyltransferase 1